MRPLASVLVFFVSATASATDRYASPTGSGSACTIGSPCQIATAAAASRPGDHVKLNNGRYTGTSSMISPTVSGTAGNPITFEAINDGQVEIDGQGVRTPVNGTLGIDYITIIGINAHSSSQEVFRLNRVNHWTLQRVVGWDAKDLNFNVLAINYGTNNLVEDFGAFGVGRKDGLAYETPGPNTFRRGWGRFEYSTVEGPHGTFTGAYNSFNTTFENILGTMDQSHTPTYVVKDYKGNPIVKLRRCGLLGGTTLSNGTCQIANHNVETGNSTTGPMASGANSGVGVSDKANLKILGSIFYMKAGIYYQFTQLIDMVSLDAVTLENTVAVYPAADAGFAGKRTIVLANGLDSHTGSIFASNTSFKGLSLGAQQPFGSDWTVTNFKEAVSPAALYKAPEESLYNTTQGAQIRYRYVNGRLTNQELWPWPMSQRIKDATTQASSDGHGHQIEDIDAHIQGAFGTFPSTAARRPTSNSTPASTPAQTPPSTSTPTSTAGESGGDVTDLGNYSATSGFGARRGQPKP